ncbi:hypothetical protein ACWJJH_20200 [Endozoicomonadaceae bacterium StTr2]
MFFKKNYFGLLLLILLVTKVLANEPITYLDVTLDNFQNPDYSDLLINNGDDPHCSIYSLHPSIFLQRVKKPSFKIVNSVFNNPPEFRKALFLYGILFLACDDVEDDQLIEIAQKFTHEFIGHGSEKHFKICSGLLRNNVVFLVVPDHVSVATTDRIKNSCLNAYHPVVLEAANPAVTRRAMIDAVLMAVMLKPSPEHQGMFLKSVFQFDILRMCMGEKAFNKFKTKYQVDDSRITTFDQLKEALADTWSASFRHRAKRAGIKFEDIPEERISSQVSNPVVARAMDCWTRQFFTELDEWSRRWNLFLASTDFFCAPKLLFFRPQVQNAITVFQQVMQEWPPNIDIAEFVTDLCDIATYEFPDYSSAPSSSGEFISHYCEPTTQIVERLRDMEGHLKSILQGNYTAPFTLFLTVEQEYVQRSYLRSDTPALHVPGEAPAANTLTIPITSVTQDPFRVNRHMGFSAKDSVFIWGDSRSLNRAVDVNPHFRHLFQQWDGKLFHGSPHSSWAKGPQPVYSGNTPPGFYVHLDPLLQPCTFVTKKFKNHIAARNDGLYDLAGPAYMVEVEVFDWQEWEKNHDSRSKDNNSGNVLLRGVGLLPGITVSNVYEITPRVQAALYQLFETSKLSKKLVIHKKTGGP